MLCHGRHWRRAQAAVFGLAAGASAAWAVSHVAAAAAQAGLPALAWPAAFALAFVIVFGLSWSGMAVQPLSLCWDGQRWSAGDEPAQVELMMHSRGFVLIRLRLAAGTRWTAVGRREAGAAWHGMLVALHGQAPAAALQAEGRVG